MIFILEFCCRLVDECVIKEAKLLVKNGEVFQAACLYLANNNILEALIVLFNVSHNEKVFLNTFKYNFECIINCFYVKDFK